jgi:hypothetical protein
VEPKSSGSIAPFLTAILLVLMLGVSGACYLLPEWLKEQRWADERAGAAAFVTLASAEVDFRANDRDGNGIRDFWTGDVAGLYTFGLISREVAEADAAPRVPLVPHPIPYRGHYIRALVADDIQTPPLVYGQVTDQKSGPIHNLKRFGFVIYPAGGINAPKYMWIINEKNTAFRSACTIPVPTTFPDDQQLKNYWSKVQ